MIVVFVNAIYHTQARRENLDWEPIARHSSSQVARVHHHHQTKSDDVEYEYNRHPFIQIYSSYQRSNLLLELSDGTVRTTRDTRDKRSE